MRRMASTRWSSGLYERAREHRATARVVRQLDRAWWAWVILRARIVDTSYVGAQLGHRVSTVGAVLRYVARGYGRGLRLNPLFVDTAVGDHLPDAHRVPALYAYLVADPRGLTISPVWNAVAYLQRHPERADERGGALGAVWRRRNVESVPTGARADTPGPLWSRLHSVVVEAAGQARSDRSVAVAGDRITVPPQVEYILTFDADEWDFDESIALAAELAGDPACSVTIVQLSGRIEDWAQVALLSATADNVRAVRVGSADLASSWYELAGGCDAATIVWRGPNDDATATTLRALASAARGGAVVGPLWLDGDGTIAGAGSSANGRLLAGHPSEDADSLPGAPEVHPPALSGSTFAAPRDLAFAASADKPDHAARVSIAAREQGAPIVLRTDLRVRARSTARPPCLPAGLSGADDLLRAAGWMPFPSGPFPRLRRRPRTVHLPGGEVVPVLRWALRTATPVGPRGEWWGDIHFARALADGLRQLGQEVVVDAYPARHRATRHLDDVTIALRGPEPIEPSPHGLSILWVISHPDEIDAAALDGFDLVYAASTPWAARSSIKWGRPVVPLLQCTDPRRFHPEGLPRGSDAVFVGTARGIYRPSVVAPVRAGIPVRVFGPDWRGWIPASAIAGTGVANQDLPPLYEGAAVVLNDHWPSMQREGFIANRPYDVVAAGGRVISDPVQGIEDVFGGAVVTYSSIDELLDLLRSDLDTVFPSPDRLAEISRNIRERDSFEARARTLLGDVVDALG